MSRVVMECDLIHPVGEVIFNAFSTFDPNEQWPGTTWIRLKGCGLFGVDEDNPKYAQSGSYVGENDHKLSIDEMPAHKSSALLNTSDGNVSGSAINWTVVNNGRFYSGDMFEFCGSDQPHNNVQRSFLGYYWL